MYFAAVITVFAALTGVALSTPVPSDGGRDLHLKRVLGDSAVKPKQGRAAEPVYDADEVSIYSKPRAAEPVYDADEVSIYSKPRAEGQVLDVD